MFIFFKVIFLFEVLASITSDDSFKLFVYVYLTLLYVPSIIKFVLLAFMVKPLVRVISLPK